MIDNKAARLEQTTIVPNSELEFKIEDEDDAVVVRQTVSK